MNISLHSTDHYHELVDHVSSSPAMSAAGVYSLAVLVRRHVRRLARVRHHSADALGAVRTGHMEKGAAAITTEGTSIEIPIPGFSRVFGPVDITPRHARALTIPINPLAYGKRAAEVGRLGFSIFRLKGKANRGILFGQPADGGEPVALYALRSRVRLRQDRSLLPTDAEMAKAAHDGVAAAIRRRRGA